jgi:uncharacterized protein YifE (UPF0438 family)
MSAPISERDNPIRESQIMNQFVKSMQKIEESMVKLNAQRELQIKNIKENKETTEAEKQELWDTLFIKCNELFSM